MSDAPRYPDIEVRLIGSDGNAFAIMGSVVRALKRNLPRDEATEAVKEYQAEAMSGDYDNLLATTMRWVEVV